MSVTATLVLWPKTAYCRLWWCEGNISLCIAACRKVNLLCLCEWIWSLFCNTLHYFNFGAYGPKVCMHTSTDTWYTNRFFCLNCKDMSISHWEMKIQTHSVIIFMHAQLTREANTDLHSHGQTHTISAASLAQGGITSIGLWGWIMLNCLFWLKTWGASHKHPSLPFPPLSFTRNISSHLFFTAYFQFAHLHLSGNVRSYVKQRINKGNRFNIYPSCKKRKKKNIHFIEDRIIDVVPVFASRRQWFM